jgi:tetratricopeptide (TPR) repeat protein
MLSNAHQNLGDVLGNPEDLNLGDNAGALFHYRKAVGISEAIAAADRQDVRARDDLAGAYRGLASVLLEEGPAEALRYYQQAVAILEELSAAEPSKTTYRLDVALTQMGAGEALHRLGRNQEALQKLAPALAVVKSLADADANELSLPAAVGRIHRDTGDALLASGDETGAREHYRQALAVAEELARRASSNLYYRRQHAEALESLGRYYGTLARRRPELKTEALEWLQRSLAIWQDWKRRNVAMPYAGVREGQVATLIASIDKL